MIFLFLACAYVLIKFLNGRARTLDIAVFLCALTAQYFFVQIFYFFLTIFAAAVALVIRFFGVLARKGLKGLAIAAVLIGLLACAYYLLYSQPSHLVDFFYICEERQSGMAGNDDAGYLIYPGTFMRCLNEGRIPVIETLCIAARGIAFFMFSPFPWSITSINQMMALPHVVIWYAVLLLSVFGFAKLATTEPETAVFTASVLVFGVATMSLVEGNIGAAFRHRDIFAPLFIIFASAAITDLLCDHYREKEPVEK
jgi:hypothetical protein